MRRRIRQLLGALILASAVGCGGEPGRSATPSAPSPSPPPTATQVSGVVVGNPQQSPVAGATVTLGTSSQSTDGSGAFTFSVSARENMLVRVSASRYIERTSTAAVAAANRQNLRIDVITDSPPFSLGFYREFARDAADSPGTLKALNPWTVAPSFYIKTTDDLGNAIPEATIEGLKRIVTNSVPPLTGGRFSVAAIETGTADRPPASGWVRVLFVRDLGNAAGNSTVGGNQGLINIRSTPLLPSTGYSCASGAAGVVVHEIVHTMGFYHTASVATATAFGVLTNGSFNCDGVRLPPSTQHHVKIVYSRAPGNRDPDADGPNVFLSNQSEGHQHTVSCFGPF